MVAVAARTAATKRGSAARRGRAAGPSGNGGRRRSRRRMGGAIKLVLSIVLLIVVFGYVSVYASLTTTSYDRSELMKQYEQEKIKNQRLKLELIRLSSPGHVMAGAERAGMIPAQDYDYLRTPDTVASAKGQAE